MDVVYLERHHLIPNELSRNSDFLQRLEQYNLYNQNSSDNIRLLPNSPSALEESSTVAVHRGSHPHYTQYVQAALQIFEVQFLEQANHSSFEIAARDAAAKILAFQEHLRAGLSNTEYMPLNRLSLYDERYDNWTREQKLQEIRDTWAQRTGHLQKPCGFVG